MPRGAECNNACDRTKASLEGLNVTAHVTGHKHPHGG